VSRITRRGRAHAPRRPALRAPAETGEHHRREDPADFDWTFNPKIPKTKIVEWVSARFVDTHAGVLLIGAPGVGNRMSPQALAPA
jgi:hypothetical protein